jgi:hypothetical protein
MPLDFSSIEKARGIAPRSLPSGAAGVFAERLRAITPPTLIEDVEQIPQERRFLTPEQIRSGRIRQEREAGQEEVARALELQQRMADSSWYGDTLANFGFQRDSFDLDKQISRAVMSNNIDEIDRLSGIKKRVDQIRSEAQKDDTSRFLGTMASVAGPMVESIKDSLGYGLAGGAAGAALGVGVGAVPGFFKGIAVGQFANWSQQGAGSLYMQLRDQGINHEVARRVSMGGGLVYGAIEQIAGLAGKLTPSLTGMLRNYMTRKLTETVLRAGGIYGANVIGETTEEALQEGVMASAYNVAAGLQEGIAEDGSELERLASGEVMGRMLEAAKESVLPIMVLGGAGGAIDLQRARSSNARVKDLESQYKKLVPDASEQTFEQLYTQAANERANTQVPFGQDKPNTIDLYTNRLRAQMSEINTQQARQREREALKAKEEITTRQAPYKAAFDGLIDDTTTPSPDVISRLEAAALDAGIGPETNNDGSVKRPAWRVAAEQVYGSDETVVDNVKSRVIVEAADLYNQRLDERARSINASRAEEIKRNKMLQRNVRDEIVKEYNDSMGEGIITEKELTAQLRKPLTSEQIMAQLQEKYGLEEGAVPPVIPEARPQGVAEEADVDQGAPKEPTTFERIKEAADELSKNFKVRGGYDAAIQSAQNEELDAEIDLLDQDAVTQRVSELTALENALDDIDDFDGAESALERQRSLVARHIRATRAQQRGVGAQETQPIEPEVPSAVQEQEATKVPVGEGAQAGTEVDQGVREQGAPVQAQEQIVRLNAEEEAIGQRMSAGTATDADRARLDEISQERLNIQRQQREEPPEAGAAPAPTPTPPTPPKPVRVKRLELQSDGTEAEVEYEKTQTKSGRESFRKVNQETGAMVGQHFTSGKIYKELKAAESGATQVQPETKEEAPSAPQVQEAPEAQDEIKEKVETPEPTPVSTEKIKVKPRGGEEFEVGIGDKVYIAKTGEEGEVVRFGKTRFGTDQAYVKDSRGKEVILVGGKAWRPISEQQARLDLIKDAESRLTNPDVVNDAALVSVLPTSDQDASLDNISTALGLSKSETRTILRRLGFKASERTDRVALGTYKPTARMVDIEDQAPNEPALTIPSSLTDIQEMDFLRVLYDYALILKKPEGTRSEEEIKRLPSLRREIGMARDATDIERWMKLTPEEIEQLLKDKKETLKLPRVSKEQKELALLRNVLKYQSIKDKRHENRTDSESNLLGALEYEFVEARKETDVSTWLRLSKKELLKEIGLRESKLGETRFQTAPSVTQNQPATKQNVGAWGRQTSQKIAGSRWTEDRTGSDTVGHLRIGTKSIRFVIGDAGMTPEGRRAAGFVERRVDGEYTVVIDKQTGMMSTPQHELGHILFDTLTDGQKGSLNTALGYDITTVGGQERFVSENLESQEGRDALADRIMGLSVDQRSVVVRAINSVIRGINAMLGTNIAEIGRGAPISRMSAQQLSEGLRDFSLILRNQEPDAMRTESWNQTLKDNNLEAGLTRREMGLGTSAIRLNEKETQYMQMIFESLGNREELLDEVPSARLSGNQLIFSEEDASALDDWLLEAHALEASSRGGEGITSRGISRFRQGLTLFARVSPQTTEEATRFQTAAQPVESMPYTQFESEFRDGKEWKKAAGKAFIKFHRARERKSDTLIDSYDKWIETGGLKQILEASSMEQALRSEWAGRTPEKRGTWSFMSAAGRALRSYHGQFGSNIRTLSRIISKEQGDYVERNIKTEEAQTFRVRADELIALEAAGVDRFDTERQRQDGINKSRKMIERIKYAPRITTNANGLFAEEVELESSEYYQLLRYMLNDTSLRGLTSGVTITDGDRPYPIKISKMADKKEELARLKAWAQSEIAANPDFAAMSRAQDKIADMMFPEINAIYKRMFPEKDWPTKDGLKKEEFYTAIHRDVLPNSSSKNRNRLVMLLRDMGSIKQREAYSKNPMLLRDGIDELYGSINRSAGFIANAEFTNNYRNLLATSTVRVENGQIIEDHEPTSYGQAIIRATSKQFFDNLLESIDQVEGTAYNINSLEDKFMNKMMRWIARGALSGPTTVAMQPLAMFIPLVNYNSSTVFAGYNSWSKGVTKDFLLNMARNDRAGGAILHRLAHSNPLEEAVRDQPVGRVGKLTRGIDKISAVGFIPMQWMDKVTVYAQGRVAWESVQQEMPQATEAEKQREAVKRWNELLQYQMVGDPSMKTIAHNKGGGYAVLNMFRSTVNAQYLKLSEAYLKAKQTGNDQDVRDFAYRVAGIALSMGLYITLIRMGADEARAFFTEIFGDDDDKKRLEKRQQYEKDNRLAVAAREVVNSIAQQLPITSIGGVVSDYITELIFLDRKDRQRYLSQVGPSRLHPYASVFASGAKTIEAYNRLGAAKDAYAENPTENNKKRIQLAQRSLYRSALDFSRYTPASTPIPIWSNFLSIDKALFNVE